MDSLLAHDGLAALEARVRHDLQIIAYPELDWVRPRSTVDGTAMLDVLIVGAGQGGLAAAFGLKRERITNILVIDKAEPDTEGPWLSFARMKTLRSWKSVNGPDLDIPSLAYQSWFEAQFGRSAWEALGKIPKESWAAYLSWYRRVLDLPVRHSTRLVGVSPTTGGMIAEVEGPEGRYHLATRALVLATGIESPGRWWMPEVVASLPAPLRAHTAEPIDFPALSGKRVAVLGAGASAFDNAATALEHGAEVTLFCRRPALQRIQPYKWLSFHGFLRHFHSLPDADRWRFMHHLLGIREALPVETWERCRRHAGFRVVTGAPFLSTRATPAGVEIETPQGRHVVDFVIAGTGFAMDASLQPELQALNPLIARWRDRYTPPAALSDERMGLFPYLGDGFTLQERTAGTAPWLSSIHLFSFAATLSFGPSGSSINGMKFAIPKLVGAIGRRLFEADLEAHYHGMLAYDTPEFDPAAPVRPLA
ncbi:MAG: NAD(P)/FAD-dependent oxidoreductase [Alphaproteobacteria bacterium]|nr:NAD(P)/FAD-dependent oxidoreductase [Alphaproteobacteria bacterium]